jgi:hypothetical protein
VLCCAVLCCAVLCCAVLCCAVLCCAVLCCAVPYCMLASLSHACLIIACWGMHDVLLVVGKGIHSISRAHSSLHFPQSPALCLFNPPPASAPHQPPCKPLPLAAHTPAPTPWAPWLSNLQSKAAAARSKLEAKLAPHPLDFSSALRVLRDELRALSQPPIVVSEGANTMDTAR